MQLLTIFKFSFRLFLVIMKYIKNIAMENFPFHSSTFFISKKKHKNSCKYKNLQLLFKICKFFKNKMWNKM